MVSQFVDGITYIRDHHNVGWSLSYLGITGALVGIAGSFIGFHLAGLLGLALGGIGLYLGAAAGAAAVVWLWRVMR